MAACALADTVRSEVEPLGPALGAAEELEVERDMDAARRLRLRDGRAGPLYRRCTSHKQCQASSIAPCRKWIQVWRMDGDQGGR